MWIRGVVGFRSSKDAKCKLLNIFPFMDRHSTESAGKIFKCGKPPCSTATTAWPGGATGVFQRGWVKDNAHVRCDLVLHSSRPSCEHCNFSRGRQAGPWILMGILCFWFVVCVSVAAVLVHGWVGGPPSARPTSSRRLRHDGRVLWGSAGPGHCMDLNGGSWSVPILHRGFGDCW